MYHAVDVNYCNSLTVITIPCIIFSRVAETKCRMFYSTELLPKGGKFNLVWLLSTTSSPDQLAKKRRKDLLKINIQVQF